MTAPERSLTWSRDYLMESLEARPRTAHGRVEALDDEGEWKTGTSLLNIVPEPTALIVLAGGFGLARRLAAAQGLILCRLTARRSLELRRAFLLDKPDVVAPAPARARRFTATI